LGGILPPLFKPKDTALVHVTVVDATTDPNGVRLVAKKFSHWVRKPAGSEFAFGFLQKQNL
jgi:hypothetical protein